jgi:predicted CoA-binding protein
MLQYDFLKTNGPVALYGLSRSGKGFARDILSALRMNSPSAVIFAIHPSASDNDLHGVQAVRSAKDFPQQPDLAVIVLKPGDARKALEDAADAGANKVWLVMNANSKENCEYAVSRGMQVVGGCPMLFVDRQSFPHNVHRSIAKLLGKV